MSTDQSARRASCTCDCHRLIIVVRRCGLVFPHQPHDTLVHRGMRDYPEVDIIRCTGTGDSPS